MAKPETAVCISTEILDEYRRVAEIMAYKFSGVDIQPILDLLIVNSDIVASPALPKPICSDLDNDKFIACAIASKTKLIVSGDKHLLDVNGYHDLEILKPRKFTSLILSAIP